MTDKEFSDVFKQITKTKRLLQPEDIFKYLEIERCDE